MNLYLEFIEQIIIRFVGNLPRCLCCFPFIEDAGSSQMERDLADFCRQYFPCLLTNNKEFIKPKEVDILIPEIKLAIEFNGLYWHSLENKPIRLPS